MSEVDVISVSDLTYRIRSLLEGSFGPLRVRGEISNFRRQSSGHMYFTLKDADCQIRAVFFRGDARRLTFDPVDGAAVVVDGELSVYPVRGEYQIRVTAMQPEGKGSLQEQFEALKRKLHAEGLFAEERKRALPVFPRSIGIVTSPTGAALRDFLQILQRRCPRLQVQIYGAKVQGQGAAEEVAEGIAELNRLGEVDVIVVARGGGSLEDLWAFNEEVLARSVAASAIPVISGVGHEIDFTICDFAADLRAPTPSAAAELVSLSDAEWQDKLQNLGQDLGKEMAGYVEGLTWKLSALREHYVFREPVRIVEQWFQRTDDLSERLSRSLMVRRDREKESLRHLGQRFAALDPSKRIAEWRLRLKAREDQLRLLSPEQTLKRGYSIVFDDKGSLIRASKTAIKAQKLKIRFADGDVDAKVE